MRTIDADKVKAESREHCKTCTLNGTKSCKTCVVNLICDRLDLQPTIQEVPHEDLISRKWLIDAIEGRRTYLSYEDARDVIDLIKKAPIVTFVSPVMNVNITEETKQKLIKELQKPHKLLVLPESEVEIERPHREWIAVKDKLPDKKGEYLVSLENGRIGVADQRGIIENHDFEPKMLAWQPLPEAYKEGDTE